MTGSRYFGGALETSDHDFFVEATTEVAKWLEKNGYNIDVSKDYTDCTIECLATKVQTCDDNTFVVQVQLVRPSMMKIKMTINAQLYRYRYWFMQFDKQQRKMIWQMMVDTCIGYESLM
jgi:hypothetical protein